MKPTPRATFGICWTGQDRKARSHQDEGDWQIMARWISDNLPFSELEFFPTYWAVNIGWHEKPARRVDSYAEPKGRWRR